MFKRKKKPKHDEELNRLKEMRQRAVGALETLNKQDLLELAEEAVKKMSHCR